MKKKIRAHYLVRKKPHIQTRANWPNYIFFSALFLIIGVSTTYYLLDGGKYTKIYAQLIDLQNKNYQELVDLNIVEKRRGLGMFITENAKKELLKLEKSKFLKNEWPNTLKRAESLGIDLVELIKKN